MTIAPVNGRLQFDQYLWDDQGDSITVKDVWISQINNQPLQDKYARPAWLREGYSIISELVENKRRVTIHFDILHAALEAVGYTINVTYTDGKTADQTCSFRLLLNAVAGGDPSGIAPNTLFVAEKARILSADTDGFSFFEIATGLTSTMVAYDAKNDWVLYTSGTTFYKKKRDDSPPIAMGAAPANAYCRGLAVDEDAGLLYALMSRVSSPVAVYLYRVNYLSDTPEATQVASLGETYKNCSGPALDKAGGKLYFGYLTHPTSYIMRMNLDGSVIEQIGSISFGPFPSEPDVKLDLTRNRAYFVLNNGAGDDSMFGYINLSNGEITSWRHDDVVELSHLAIDVINRVAYLSSDNTNAPKKIYTINMDTGGGLTERFTLSETVNGVALGHVVG